jgi:hypothetical protein
MSRVLELPEPVYEALEQVARASGVSPADWVARQLPSVQPAATPEERQAALERLLRHTVSLGHPTGVDNESIDADLAREGVSGGWTFGTQERALRTAAHERAAEGA